MNCEKYNSKKCKGKRWCNICPLYRDWYEQTPVEKFAMELQQKFFEREQFYLKAGNKEKAMSYGSCIQIMEGMLK